MLRNDKNTFFFYLFFYFNCQNCYYPFRTVTYPPSVREVSDVESNLPTGRWRRPMLYRHVPEPFKTEKIAPTSVAKNNLLTSASPGLLDGFIPSSGEKTICRFVARFGCEYADVKNTFLKLYFYSLYGRRYSHDWRELLHVALIYLNRTRIMAVPVGTIWIILTSDLHSYRANFLPQRLNGR